MSRAELRSQSQRLQKQLREAKTAEPLQGLLEQVHGLLAEYESQLSEAEAKLAALKQELFGRKSERVTAEQEEQVKKVLQDMEEEEKKKRDPAASADVLEDEDKPKVKRKTACRRVRHPLPTHLETETVTIEPELVPCGHCGRMPERIGQEVSEEIDLIPAKLIRRRIVRGKYACGCGQAGVAVAPMPARLIPQSRLGLGLAVHILLSRFDDHLSFYRLQQQFLERNQLEVPRQQMVQWVDHMAQWLQPLYDLMWKGMLAGGYVQVDETPVRVLDPEVKGKAARGYLWFYAQPGGDVLLDFDPSRGLLPVQRRLQDFAGTIQTDAYEVYQALQRQQPLLQRIGCLAHARRRFYQALRENLSDAVWFIVHIRKLYRIEDQIRGLPAAERLLPRQQQAQPIWETLKSKAQELQPNLLPKSTMGKAISYFLDEYDALIGYLQDGRFEIDNNLVENSIRPTAVGRRRWLFIGHPDAGWRSAVIYSMILSCRRRGLNPQEYLTDILRRLPIIKANQLITLLPGNWKPQADKSG